MARRLSIEERVARFLIEESISILNKPSKNPFNEYLYYFRHNNPEPVKIGYLKYSTQTGVIEGRHSYLFVEDDFDKLESKLVSPIRFLLTKTNGNYNHDIWVPIRRASIRVLIVPIIQTITTRYPVNSAYQ